MRPRYPFLRHVALGTLLLLVIAVLAFFAGSFEDRRAAFASVVVAGVVLVIAFRFAAKVFLVDALLAGAVIALFVSMGLYDDVRIRRLRKILPVGIAEVSRHPPEVILELQGGVARFELASAETPSVTPVVASDWSRAVPVEVWAVGDSAGHTRAGPRPIEENRFAFPIPRSDRKDALAAAHAVAVKHGLRVAPEPRLVKLVKDPRFELGNRLLLHFYAPVGVYMLWVVGVISFAIASARRSAEPATNGK